MPRRVLFRSGTDRLPPISLSHYLTDPATHHCEQHSKHRD
jgi:hypothetical protein